MLLCQVSLWTVGNHSKAVVLLAYDWLFLGFLLLFSYFRNSVVLLEPLGFWLVWRLGYEAWRKCCTSFVPCLILGLVLTDVDAYYGHSFDLTLFLIDFSTAAMFATCGRLRSFKPFTGTILAHDSSTTPTTLGFVTRCRKLHRLYA